MSDEPRTYRGKLGDTDVEVWVCSDDHIHVRLEPKEGEKVSLIFGTPENGYDFAQLMLRAYDEAVGIGSPEPN